MRPITGLPPEVALARPAPPRRRAHAGAWRHLPTIGLVAAILIAVPIAVRVIGDEAVVSEASERLRSFDRAERGGAQVGLDDVRPLSADSPPRAVLAHANLVARAAAVDAANRRRAAALAEAQEEVARLLGDRPHWADAWVVASVIAEQRGHDRAAIAALDRSYGEAGYLRGAGAWRVATAFANWDRLSDRARIRAVDEAVWLARIDKRIRDDVFSLARQSPAYRPLLLRWRELRLGGGG